MLMGLMRSHVWLCMVAELIKYGSCIVLVTDSSVTGVCLSCMTQLHMTHSAMCNIVWFHQDSPTRHPVGVPCMVDQR